MNVVSIVAKLIAAAVIVGMVSAIPLGIWVIRTKRLHRSTKMFLGVVVFVVLAVPIGFAWVSRMTPEARPINDRLQVTDASGNLTLHSLTMPAPSYGVAVKDYGVEKLYESRMELYVTNDSDETAYLGVEYYADSGQAGVYSPGSIQRARVLPIEAGWSGPVEVPVRHFRFVDGGTIRMQFGKCAGPAQGIGMMLPGNAETLVEKTYAMTAE